MFAKHTACSAARNAARPDILLSKLIARGGPPRGGGGGQSNGTLQRGNYTQPCVREKHGGDFANLASFTKQQAPADGAAMYGLVAGKLAAPTSNCLQALGQRDQLAA